MPFGVRTIAREGGDTEMAYLPSGIQLAPPRKCALEGCSEPCYVDDKGDIHECCSYIHGMEHSRRTEEGN